MFSILLDSFIPSMHSIPIHKYPSPPYTTYTHTIPSSLFFPQTMKHYNPTHYHLMYMNSKFPSCEVATFHQEPFGGFTWPPRSYTCTFCRREFRSAQALGGHMNVHRKDRARLKQSSLAPEIIHHQKQTCDPYQENFSGFSDPHLLQLSPPIFTDNDEDFVETKLSMGIDSVRKKHKKSSSVVSSPLQFINSQVCSSDRGSGGSSMEEIDLELRLGDPTAVK